MANFTKQAIETAFLQLLNEKPLNKISVRDIVEKCGINRNSFYYHFQDIPSLIAEIITSYTDQLIEEYPTISTLDECCEMAFRYALQNRSAVMHIYHSVNRDLFEESTMRLCEYAVTTYIDTAFPQHQLPEADRRAEIRFTKCQLFECASTGSAAGCRMRRWRSCGVSAACATVCRSLSSSAAGTTIENLGKYPLTA